MIKNAYTKTNQFAVITNTNTNVQIYKYKYKYFSLNKLA